MTGREFNEGLQRHLMRCALQYRAANAPKGSEVDWLAPHCGTVQEIARFLRELGFRIKEISDCSDCAGTKFHWVVTTSGIVVYENDNLLRGFIAMSAGNRERRKKKVTRPHE